MDALGPMDFFSETDRLAITQQLRMQQAGSRNVADYFRAMRGGLEQRGDDPETRRRLEELDKGIAAAESKVEELERNIASWEH